MHHGDIWHASQGSIEHINDQMKLEIIDTVQVISPLLKTSQISLP